MPPSGFSKITAKAIASFIGGCQKDLKKEVTDGKHHDLESGRKFEISQIKKAMTGTSDQFQKAVLEVVCVAYELNLSAKDVERVVANMHITPKGKLVAR